MQNNLMSVLEDMREAVLTGNYTRLSALLPVLSEVEKTFKAQDITTLAGLRAMAAQNAACLDAAISGIKSARRRMTEIAQAESGLTTYDRGGAKATLLSAVPRSRRV